MNKFINLINSDKTMMILRKRGGGLFRKKQIYSIHMVNKWELNTLKEKEQLEKGIRNWQMQSRKNGNIYYPFLLCIFLGIFFLKMHGVFLVYGT